MTKPKPKSALQIEETLITVEALAREFYPHTRYVIENVLRKAKIAHVHTILYGRGMIKLYDKAQVRPVLKAEFEKRSAAAPAAASALSADVLKPVVDNCASIRNDVEDVFMAVAKLQEQNVALLAAIEAVRKEATERWESFLAKA